MQAQMETEESQESKDRQKIIFKKLLFLNTKRLLEILKFKPGESERKKLQSSVQSPLIDNQIQELPLKESQFEKNNQNLSYQLQDLINEIQQLHNSNVKQQTRPIQKSDLN